MSDATLAALHAALEAHLQDEATAESIGGEILLSEWVLYSASVLTEGQGITIYRRVNPVGIPFHHLHGMSVMLDRDIEDDRDDAENGD